MRSSLARRSPRGFTLVELMVAVTGGLFVAIAVFMLARDGSRFYQHESRAADATVGAMVGFGRLQADIARAGFLASPNLWRDPSHCEREESPTGWPSKYGFSEFLSTLGSVRIQSSSGLPQVLTDNQRSPDQIVVSGSFSSADEFPTAGFDKSGGQLGVVLQTRVGPLPRLGYLSLTDPSARLALLGRIFLPYRALRIVDQSGMTHYGVIDSVGFSNLGDPRVQLLGTPAPLFRDRTQSFRCALTGTDTMGRVSVVNMVRYELRHVNATTNPGYAPLFANTATTEMADWEQGRTELVREELSAASATATGDAIPGTTEIVAEYAVDLKFGITAITNFNGTEPSQLQTYLAGDDANIARFAGPSSATVTPELIRAVRLRLSVRSAVPDRAAGIVGGNGTPIPQGAFFRMDLGNNRFARVRTLQADVALPNHAGVTW